MIEEKKQKKTIYKLPHAITDETGRILKKDHFEKHIINTDRNFHFGAGELTKEHFEKEGFFELNKHKIAIFNSTHNDYYSKLQRGAQTINKKDIGPIITKTGMNRETIVIDAGAGSGGLSCFLSGIVKQVDTYDINEKNLEIVQKNINKLELKNVKAEIKNIYESEMFPEKKYDVFTLDVPEPWRAWKTAHKVLKIGGYLVVYSPNIIQVRETIMKKPEEFFLEETVEIIEREWSISERISRPVTKDFSHTAFLVFFRKISN